MSLKVKILKFMKKVPVVNKLEGFAKKHIGSRDYKNASDRDVDEYGEDERISDSVIDEGYGDDEIEGYSHIVTEEEFDTKKKEILSKM